MLFFFPRSLEKLNVSYNQIEDLSGLKCLSGPLYKLSLVDLHGNKLSSVAHISQCLVKLQSLRHLILSQDGSGNAVCHKPGTITKNRACSVKCKKAV